MSILDNDLTIYEQFKTFFPQWLLEFYEFDEILKREASIAEKMQAALDLIIDNHFMDYMDEDTITQFEAFLGLSPSSDDLEYRRNMIKAYYLGRGKLSMSQIVSTVEILSGGQCSGIFDLIDEDSNNGITLTVTDSDIRGAIVDILKTLLERIPAHLALKLIYKPIVAERGIKEFVQLSQRTDETISTAGQRTEKVQGSPKAFVQSSQSPNNVIKAQMVIYDSGSFTDEHEDIIDGGGFTPPVSDNVLDFNY